LSTKYLLFITGFANIKSIIETSKDILKELNENFTNFTIVNFENLNFSSKKFRYDIDLFPGDFKYFNPIDIAAFTKFCKNKEVLVINHFGRDYGTLGIHYTLKVLGISQIMITKIGNIQMDDLRDWKYFILSVKSYFKRVLFKKFIHFLILIKILRQIEIRFISNNFIIEDIKSNYLKNFLYRNKLLYIKELIPVNSRTYDFFFKNKTEISEDYIVHLDASLNYKEETDLRGYLDKTVLEKHYFFLTRFLEKLSRDYKKEIIICIHPSYNLIEHKLLLKKFKVFQFKTRDYICRAFVVTNFNSSAVCDAVFLKKKIIGLTSNQMTKNEIIHSKIMSTRIGYLNLNLEDDYNYDWHTLLINMKKKIKGYDNYINNFHLIDKNISGNKKIVETIKSRFNFN
jgi:hypothetical protein